MSRSRRRRQSSRAFTQIRPTDARDHGPLVVRRATRSAARDQDIRCESSRSTLLAQTTHVQRPDTKGISAVDSSPPSEITEVRGAPADRGEESRTLERENLAMREEEFRAPFEGSPIKREAPSTQARRTTGNDGRTERFVVSWCRVEL
jgi:hypothetical protein